MDGTLCFFGWESVSADTSMCFPIYVDRARFGMS